MAGRTLDERFARQIADLAPDGFVVIDGSGKVAWLNAAAEALFGWAHDELVGQPIERLVPEVLRGAHEAHRRGYVRAPRSRPMGAGLTLRARRRDGSEIAVEISLCPLETPDGVFTLASARDVSERQAALDALHASETRLRELVEQAADGIFVADLEGRYTDVNSAACRMLGYTREELLGKTIADIIPPSELARLHAARERLLTPGAVDIAEWTLLRKDGTAVPVEVSAKILPDGRWQAIVRDVTERRRAAEALRASEEHLRRAQKVARMGSWDWDLRSNEIVRSPEILALYGLQPGHEHERPFSLLELIPSEERPRIVDTITTAIREGRAYEVEHRLVRPDGEERVFLQKGETLSENGKAVRAVGTTLDITDLRRAEHERAAAMRELEVVLEECPVGITIVRGSGQRLHSNHKAREMQGEPFDPSGGLTQYSGTLRTPDGAAIPLEQFPAMRALAGERVEALELAFERPDGKTIPVEVNAVPLANADGRVTGALVVWHDITPLKDLERLRAEWNSVVAHDLRQPINAIGLHAQLLARQAQAWPEEARDWVLTIRKLATRLARMTHDLIDLSRLEASRLALARRPLDLAACVRESVAQIALEAADRSFELHVGDGIPVIDGDADRLAQIMENLLTNAVKYGRAGSPIRVGVEREGDTVTVSVANEGTGLERAELQELFQRFHRLGPSQQSVEGIGLGLMITRGLVEAHGGHLHAESVPGATTTFRFTLPVPKMAGA